MLWPPEETAAFFLLCFAFTSMRRLMLDDDTCLARLLPGSTKRFAEEVVLKEPQIVVFFFVMVPQTAPAPPEEPLGRSPVKYLLTTAKMACRKAPPSLTRAFKLPLHLLHQHLLSGVGIRRTKLRACLVTFC
jgi:hypothetical protein